MVSSFLLSPDITIKLDHLRTELCFCSCLAYQKSLSTYVIVPPSLYTFPWSPSLVLSFCSLTSYFHFRRGIVHCLNKKYRPTDFLKLALSSGGRKRFNVGHNKESHSFPLYQEMRNGTYIYIYTVYSRV
jgi:hypothetical protein